MKISPKHMREVFALTLLDYKNRSGLTDNEHAALVFSYIYHLRPLIDRLPEYELYTEWSLAQEDSTPHLREDLLERAITPRLDLVVVKHEESPLKNDPEAVTVIEGYVVIAMEFKSGMYSRIDLNDLKNRLKKLAEFRKNGAHNGHPYYLGDGIKRVNKGDSPDHAFYFILDFSFDEEEQKKSAKTYERLHEKYPLVEIVYGFAPHPMTTMLKKRSRKVPKCPYCGKKPPYTDGGGCDKCRTVFNPSLSRI